MYLYVPALFTHLLYFSKDRILKLAIVLFVVIILFVVIVLFVGSHICGTFYLLAPQKWSDVKDKCQWKSRALSSRCRLCSLLPCGLRKVIQPLWSWRSSQIWPQQNDLRVLPDSPHSHRLCQTVSPFLCVHTSTHRQGGYSTYTCLSLAFLSASSSSSTYSAKSSYCHRLYLLIPPEFSEHRLSRNMFKMSSSLIPPTSHQSLIYVFSLCKLKCLQGASNLYKCMRSVGCKTMGQRYVIQSDTCLATRISKILHIHNSQTQRKCQTNGPAL